MWLPVSLLASWHCCSSAAQLVYSASLDGTVRATWLASGRVKRVFGDKNSQSSSGGAWVRDVVLREGAETVLGKGKAQLFTASAVRTTQQGIVKQWDMRSGVRSAVATSCTVGMTCVAQNVWPVTCL